MRESRTSSGAISTRLSLRLDWHTLAVPATATAALCGLALIIAHLIIIALAIVIPGMPRTVVTIVMTLSTALSTWGLFLVVLSFEYAGRFGLLFRGRCRPTVVPILTRGSLFLPALLVLGVTPKRGVIHQCTVCVRDIPVFEGNLTAAAVFGINGAGAFHYRFLWRFFLLLDVILLLALLFLCNLSDVSRNLLLAHCRRRHRRHRCCFNLHGRSSVEKTLFDIVRLPREMCRRVCNWFQFFSFFPSHVPF
mmetsp:Transcript_58867/g.95152  ORF Transcript_58867/g.95152 Transcript_58867/m.95152 type:complete len:250 (+) Transcript_58867:378-1127(+)